VKGSAFYELFCLLNLKGAVVRASSSDNLGEIPGVAEVFDFDFLGSIYKGASQKSLDLAGR